MSACANNQVFVNVFSTPRGLVHYRRTHAALDDGNYSLLQHVCGGFLDSSVSPAWERMKLAHRCTIFLCYPILEKYDRVVTPLRRL